MTMPRRHVSTTSTKSELVVAALGVLEARRAFRGTRSRPGRVRIFARRELGIPLLPDAAC
jgi:hypothetical protein